MGVNLCLPIQHISSMHKLPPFTMQISNQTNEKYPLILFLQVPCLLALILSNLISTF